MRELAWRGEVKMEGCWKWRSGGESSLGRKKVIRVPSCSWHNKWLVIPGSSHLEPVSGERGIRWSYSGT